jgi:hypothetical protein
VIPIGALAGMTASLMRFRLPTSYAVLVVAPVAFALGCQSRTAYPNSYEYLKAKGFGAASFAQVRRGETVKNINAQLPSLLNVLRDSEMISKRPVEPSFTIYLQSGSSWASQTVSIQIGKNGYGVIEHVKQRAFFHCPELPSFADASFNESTIVVGPGASP